MIKPNNSNNVFDYIMKRHGYYKSKFEILYERNKGIKKLPGGKGIKSEIEQKKRSIRNLKQQLINEENSLLNLYKNRDK